MAYLRAYPSYLLNAIADLVLTQSLVSFELLVGMQPVSFTMAGWPAETDHYRHLSGTSG